MPVQAKDVIAVLAAAAATVKEVMPLIQAGALVWSTDDLAAIKSAMMDIHNANDELYPLVQSKLRGDVEAEQRLNAERAQGRLDKAELSVPAAPELPPKPSPPG